jgi:hypothetical protein
MFCVENREWNIFVLGIKKNCRIGRSWARARGLHHFRARTFDQFGSFFTHDKDIQGGARMT